MQHPPNTTIGTIDDISGALSAIRESVAILAARRRDDLTEMDEDEMDRILDACDRIQSYHLIIRAVESRRYQEQVYNK